jgi:hypothetical protein
MSRSMNELLPPRIAVAANDCLDAWDAEGGASGVGGEGRPATQRLLLERLGAALLDEWHALPTPVRRALYERAVTGEATACDRAPLKRRLARLLHDHQALQRE